MQTRYFTRGRVPPPRTMVVKRTTIKVVVTSTFLTYILSGRFLIYFYMTVNPPPGRFLIHFYMTVNPPPHQIQGEGRVHRQLRPWKRNHILSSLPGKGCLRLVNHVHVHVHAPPKLARYWEIHPL